MIPLKSALSSSVGRKFFMALTGIGLVLFVILHLVGNLQLLLPSGDTFNLYGHKLQSMGALSVILEISLVILFLAHIIAAIKLKLTNKAARPIRYEHNIKTKGGESKNNISSRNMIVTGLILFIFLILHVRYFRFGPGISDGYVTTINGEEVRDLYRVVIEAFKNPAIVAFYTFVMLLLGLHLRHGFWSAFQSLGLQNPRIAKPIYAVGILLAVLLTIGFVALPIGLYLKA